MVFSVLLPCLSHLLLLLLLLLFFLLLLLDTQQVVAGAGSARAGSLCWPCHLDAPGITLLQEQGVAGRAGAFDLRSEVGKEALLQIPCQLVWLISSRAHSNKNQHLHNTWGHLGSTLQSVKDYVPSQMPLSLEGELLSARHNEKASCSFWDDGSPHSEVFEWVYTWDRAGVGVSIHLPGSSSQTKTALATQD